MPTALITGASSGIGRELAVKLSENGYSLILAARRGDRLNETSRLLKSPAEIITIDLSSEENCISLYEKCRAKNIDVLVNNAGFGYFGNFRETELDRELEMIDLNVKAVHILTKLFLRDFAERGSGKILNVASAAGFMPSGPKLAAYYATKAYVLNLTRSIAKELKKSGSRVTVSALCPGPVKTEFDSVAGIKFGMAGLDAKKAAEAAVKGMEKGRTVIVPGAVMKMGRILAKLLPDGVLAAFAYKFQNSKEEK